ncbi:LON peptidase substrate-binding domain-containing protein, partial [bacterium]|nr:LON peptidase substrate-binding domain-containing protein [bacterium]
MKGKNRKIRITGEVSDPNVMYLPVVPLRGMVLFPHTITPVMIGRERTIEAVNYASSLDKRVFVVAQRDKMVELPQDGDLYTTGTVGKIVQIMKYPDERMKVLIEGESRASVVSYNFKKKIITAVVSPYELEKDFDEAKIKAHYEKVVELFRRYLRLTSPLQEFPAELILDEENANIEKNLNVIAATLKVPSSTHQYLLESVSIIEYMEKLIETLIDEINIGKYKQEIDKKVSDLIDKNQKEYFLRQQLEVIKEELGESYDNEEEIEELRKKLQEGNYPEIVHETVEQELKKLSRMHPTSPEAAVCRNYIDWLLELPWNASTEDNRDIE